MQDITEIESEAVQDAAPAEPDQLAVIVASSPLEKTKAEKLKEMFVPYLNSMGALEKKIAAIDKENPTKVDVTIARETRLALVKNRTAAEKKKDELKESIIIEGNIITSFFAVINNTSKSIELSLSNIEKAAEIKEASRKKQLAAERTLQLQEYEIDLAGYDLGAMADGTFEQLLENTKAGHEKRLEDKRKEEELKVQREASERLNKEREQELRPIWQFVPEEFKHIDFSAYDQIQWGEILSASLTARNEYEMEQTRIREENERLKKEAEEKEKAAKGKQELQSRRYRALLPYSGFIEPGLPEDLSELTTDAFDSVLFDAQAAYNKDKQEREAKELQAKKEAEEQAAKLKATQDEADRIAAQQKAAVDKLEADKKAAGLAKKKAELAPDKDKLLAFASVLDEIPLPELKSEESNTIAASVRELLNKVSAYIREKTQTL